MNYAVIRECDIANGEGVRVSLFVSGCTHRCPGCFNPDQWDFNCGRLFDDEAQERILKALAPHYIAGLSLLGGEPMEPDNQRALVPFLRRFRECYGKTKDLWVYTGCVLEADLAPEARDSRWRTEVTDEFLELTDVLVDGPFVQSLKNISLAFRGSSNQRILRLHGK